MILKWVPGEPSGPSKKVYYSTAKHDGGDFTLCVTYHSGVPKYGLSRAGVWLGFHPDRAAALTQAEGVVGG